MRFDSTYNQRANPGPLAPQGLFITVIWATTISQFGPILRGENKTWHIFLVKATREVKPVLERQLPKFYDKSGIY